MDQFALGADIGGSHITCQLFNLTKQKPLEHTRCRLNVDSTASKNEIVEIWTSAIRLSTKDYSFTSLSGIGFAMPGPFDYSKGIGKFRGVQKYDNLYDVNVRKEIQHRLNLTNQFPIRFLNDASCFGIGESWIGEASNYSRTIAFTLGTGFGSTFLINGIPVKGKDGIPEDGFLYHISYKDSIADDYFSARWFLNEYHKRTGNKSISVKDLSLMALSDPNISALFQDFGENLGEFLVPWIKKFNAGCIVLGGNISKSLPLFHQEIMNEFHSYNLHPFLYHSILAEDAALYGSARLCDDKLYSRLN